MEKIILSIIIGTITGIIDIIPMLIQKLDKYSIISAFVQWIVVAFVITHIQFGIEGWLKGLIVGVLMGIPVIILIIKTDPKSVIPILVMCTILGSLVGFTVDKYIK